MNSNVKTSCICPYFIKTGMFEGCQTKWPWLLPILEVDWITKRIVDAIRQEEKVLITPYWASMNYTIRTTIPTAAFDFIQWLMGTDETLEDVKGRNNNKQLGELTEH